MMMRHADARLRIAFAVFWVGMVLAGLVILLWQGVIVVGIIIAAMLLGVFLTVGVMNSAAQKRKNHPDEKPKRRDQTYTVGDDGELHLIEELENTTSQR